MNTRAAVAAILLLSLPFAACCQEPTQAAAPNQARQTTIYDISHGAAWPHIGSPPPENSPAVRVEAWRRENASYAEALDSIRRSWTGVAQTPDDLRYKVQQYEDLIRTVTESGGYGNLVLASILRRISDSLLGYYAVIHFQDSGVARELLEKERVSLLDCPAAGDMVAEELNAPSHSGGWHLSERSDVELILRSNRSSLGGEFGRMLMGRPTPSQLMTKRDVNGLIAALITEEMTERSTLPTLLEYFRLGGDPSNLASWISVMKGKERIFPFMLMGQPKAGSMDVAWLINWSRGWEGKQVPFAAFIGEATQADH